MSSMNLQSSPGELKFTVEITRAATGLKEIVEITSTLTQDQEDALVAAEIIKLNG